MTISAGHARKHLPVFKSRQGLDPPGGRAPARVSSRMRTAGAFTKSEVEAAIKGAIDAGMIVARVEIEPAKITITSGRPGEPVTTTPRAQFESWNWATRRTFWHSQRQNERQKGYRVQKQKEKKRKRINWLGD